MLKECFTEFADAILHASKDGGIDVFVPPYANTFPVASAARDAIDKLPAGAGSSIHIKHYPWAWDTGWSGLKSSPPFHSQKRYQAFFATRGEFETIYRDGITFIAQPITVFHPRFLFVSPPKEEDDDGTKKERTDLSHHLSLAEIISRCDGALAIGAELDEPSDDSMYLDRLQRQHGSQLDLPNTRWNWVTDIPDQALGLAKQIASALGQEEEVARVAYWKERSIEEALGLDKSRNDGHFDRLLPKAYLWSGPLASASLKDVQGTLERDEPTEGRTDTLAWPRLRARDAVTFGIRLPGLLSLFQGKAERIDEHHTTYFCVGYKEDVKIEERYKNPRKYSEDRQSGNFPEVDYASAMASLAMMEDENLRRILDTSARFFEKLYSSVEGQAGTASEQNAKLLKRLRIDFDEHCRTVDPISQLFVTETYVQCLKEHHDADAMDKILKLRMPERLASDS